MTTTDEQYEAFSTRLRELIEGDRKSKAQELTKRFWTDSYTGHWFHELADTAHPNEITANDIVAVSTLAVTVPARVAIWLLRDGQEPVTKLLAPVPADVDIWDGAEYLAENGLLWQLWELLRTSCWPEPDDGNGMGVTRLSKLLATKRPRLVPIYDSVVRGVLAPVPNHWEAFRRALADSDLRDELATASAAGAPDTACFLRRLDVMLWMLGNEPGWE